MELIDRAGMSEDVGVRNETHGCVVIDKVRSDECNGLAGPNTSSASARDVRIFAASGDGLGVFTSAASGEDAEAYPIKDGGEEAENGQWVCSAKELKNVVHGVKHVQCERFFFGLGFLPFASQTNDVVDGSDEFWLGTVGGIDGERTSDYCVKVALGTVNVVFDGGCADGFLGDGVLAIEEKGRVGAEQIMNVGLLEADYTIIGVVADLEEPVTKVGSSIVQSLVIFASNQASVCGLSFKETRIDKTSRGTGQIGRLRRPGLSITEVHDGQFSKRER